MKLSETGGGLGALSRLLDAKSRSVSPENPTGAPGGGARTTNGTKAHHGRDLGPGWKNNPCVTVAPGETVTLCDITGPGVIRHIWFADNTDIDRSLILRFYWDDSPVPSVACPVGDFFASATYQSYSPLSSLAVCVNPMRGLNCYWSMPFRRRARVTLENILPAADRPTPLEAYYSIDYLAGELPEDAGYFHAQFRRQNPVPYQVPYTILDGVAGRGQYVGTYLFWSTHSNDWWGEGEFKFYLDGDGEYPTICGTGTEDYFGGAYNFDVGGKYTEFSNAYAGLAKVVSPADIYHPQPRFSLYRWHIADPICFEQDLRVTVQALGWRQFERYRPLMDDISSVAYWYAEQPAAAQPPLPDFDGLELY